MGKHLVQINWFAPNENGDLLAGDDSSNELVADLSTGKIYGQYDDIGEVDDPYFFYASGIGGVMSELIREDESFLTDELTEKWLIEAIKQQLTEPKLEDGIIRLMNWKKPHFGEVTLIYELNSFQSNHPLDPVEWDVTIDCIGALGLNYELIEK